MDMQVGISAAPAASAADSRNTRFLQIRPHSTQVRFLHVFGETVNDVPKSIDGHNTCAVQRGGWRTCPAEQSSHRRRLADSSDPTDSGNRAQAERI